MAEGSPGPSLAVLAADNGVLRGRVNNLGYALADADAPGGRGPPRLADVALGLSARPIASFRFGRGETRRIHSAAARTMVSGFADVGSSRRRTGQVPRVELCPIVYIAQTTITCQGVAADAADSRIARKTDIREVAAKNAPASAHSWLGAAHGGGPVLDI